MKSRLNSLAALIAFFGASQAFAQSVQTEVTQPSSAFVASAEAGQFGIASQSITSAGLKLGYEFRASSKFSLGLTAAQDFSISGFSSLSTGFGGVVRYHLSGDWFPRTETTTLNGEKIAVVKTEIEPGFSVTAGIQQLLLTGNTSLYPSPGLAVGGAYNFRWMNLNWNAQAEYGMYSASNKDVSAMLIEFGVLLNP